MHLLQLKPGFLNKENFYSVRVKNRVVLLSKKTSYEEGNIARFTTGIFAVSYIQAIKDLPVQ
jgi:hypothetical protein